MNIALIPMSAKPYHLGHHKLIQLAAKTSDVVLVFVSYSGRGVRKIKDPNDKRTIKAGARKIIVPKPGEVPIFGDDMKYIWEEFLLGELLFDGNVDFITPDLGGHASPVRNIHTVCESLVRPGVHEIPFLDLELDTAKTSVSIFSDANDIVENYNIKEMKRMYGSLMGKNIHLVGVSRLDTVDISGTRMRELLRLGDFGEFKRFLPPVAKKTKNIITKILSDSLSSGSSFYYREQQKNTVKYSGGLSITLG